MSSEAWNEFATARQAPISRMLVKKLNEHATIPTYGSNGAAGMDLYANFASDGIDMVSLFPGERLLIKTGIAIAIPRGMYARIAPRSGLAYKHGIDVMAGVVDEDYRGDVGVILINLGSEPFVVKHGDRIAQLIVTPYFPCLAEQVDELPDTIRSAKGFGSTGK